MGQIEIETKQVGLSTGSWCEHFEEHRFDPKVAAKEGWMDLSKNVGERLHYCLPCEEGVWALKFNSESGCCRSFQVFLFVRVDGASEKVESVSFTLVEIFSDGEVEPKDYCFGLDPADEDMAKAELSKVTAESGRVN